MNGSSAWPTLPHAIAWALACVALLHALRNARWQTLSCDAAQQRLLLLTFIALASLRHVNTHAMQGVLLSFLGSAIATLMFGPWRALLLLALVSAVDLVSGDAWQGWAADYVAGGVAPVLVAAALLHWARQKLPAHVFVYVIVNGFLAGALSMGACNLLKAAAIAAWGGGWSEGYLIATIPMMFGEGFLTGGAMALMVAYRPDWVATFDDARYLAKRD